MRRQRSGQELYNGSKEGPCQTCQLKGITPAKPGRIRYDHGIPYGIHCDEHSIELVFEARD